MGLPEIEFEFGERPHPTPPDYADLNCWCAHPAREGDATNTLVPEDGAPASSSTGLQDVSQRPADFFFVVGTNFISNSSWNAPVPDEICDEWCDVDVVAFASAANVCCRVWAPRYRQTIVQAHNEFMKDSATPERRRGAFACMDLAYSDVERAFEHFVSALPTADSPIFVAGHSQGAQHVVRLLERFEADAGLRSRLVCAYVLGPCGSFPADRFERCFPSLRPCAGPLDSGCVVAFDSISEKHPTVQKVQAEGAADVLLQEGTFPMRNRCADAPRLVRYPGACADSATGAWESPSGKAMFCTNPLTWSSVGERAPARLHLGAVAPTVVAEDGTAGDFRRDCFGRVRTGVRTVSVKKLEGSATFAEIGFEGGALLLSGDSQNHDEWERFYLNIRENIARRTESFLGGGKSL